MNSIVQQLYDYVCRALEETRVKREQEKDGPCLAYWNGKLSAYEDVKHILET